MKQKCITEILATETEYLFLSENGINQQMLCIAFKK